MFPSCRKPRDTLMLYRFVGNHLVLDGFILLCLLLHVAAMNETYKVAILVVEGS